MTLAAPGCFLASAVVSATLSVAACGGGGSAGGSSTARAAGWSATGALPDPHLGGEAATILNDGRVLVVGGTGRLGTATAAADVYDPVTQTWSATGSLPTPVVSPTATLLRGGEVLVAGGVNQLAGRATTAAALYDPSATDPATGRRGRWTPTAPLTTARAFHTATLLADGRVLVAGGCDRNCGGHLDDSTATAELFDPTATDPATGARGRWLPAASMGSARTFHTATLLRSGSVLVVGGDAGTTLAPPEVYDPAAGAGHAGAWRSAGDEVSGIRRLEHTATLLRSGKVLVVGGRIGVHGSNLSTAELYDPQSGAWTLTGTLSANRSMHTATLLPDGEVVVIGGYGDHNTALATAEIYDPTVARWYSVAPATASHSGHSAILLDRQPCGQGCDRVLVAAGVDCTRNCPPDRQLGVSALLFTPPSSGG